MKKNFYKVEQKKQEATILYYNNIYFLFPNNAFSIPQTASHIHM